MRAGVLFGVMVAVALALGLGLGAPAESRAGIPEASAGCGTTCGVPECNSADIRVRPDMTRAVEISCSDLKNAQLVSQPGHSVISNVRVEGSGINFDVHPEPSGPRFEDVLFDVTGYSGDSARRRFQIEVVPTSENSPPVCSDEKATERSDGQGPVDVYLSPWCRDPDGDEFVIRGGPPGVHPESPMKVSSEWGHTGWHYRTATFDGTETTRIWATDVLGARSEDAELEVTVGPGVDRPPECRPLGWYQNEVRPIPSRPGAVRNFGLYCTDPDADPFTAAISSPPQRGLIPLFVMGPRSTGYWGLENWIDATYVPVDAGLEPDPFTVTASGPNGPGPVSRMAIVPRALPANGGGGCGWSSASIQTNVPGELTVNCDDEEGDPFSARVITPPKHGTTTPALISPAGYGNSDITVPYIPEPGYEGYDCAVIEVTDGNGLKFELSVDIWIHPEAPVEVIPPLPELPTLPIGPTPAKHSRPLAEMALGTTAVKRVHTSGDAELWARAEVSRDDLMHYGRAPAMFVVCPQRCKVRSGSALEPALPRHRAGRPKAVATGTGPHAEVLTLAISPAERRQIRKAPRPRGKFRIRIQAKGEPASSVERSIPISR